MTRWAIEVGGFDSELLAELYAELVMAQMPKAWLSRRPQLVADGLAPTLTILELDDDRGVVSRRRLAP